MRDHWIFKIFTKIKLCHFTDQGALQRGGEGVIHLNMGKEK